MASANIRALSPRFETSVEINEEGPSYKKIATPTTAKIRVHPVDGSADKARCTAWPLPPFKCDEIRMKSQMATTQDI